jgi:signal transduction histidine kinase/GAF domain-containing protein
MSGLSEVSNILSSSLGSLVYHLLLLLAVQAALGITWGERRRGRQEQAQRLLLAMLGLTAVRIAYVVAALVASSGWARPEVLLPPLERFADTASIALLGWAFMPPAKGGVRAWDLIFGGNLALAIGACVVFVFLWSNQLIANNNLNYNAHWQALVWTLWQMALVPLAIVAVLRDRQEGWGIFFLAMVLMFAGQILQLILPTAVPHLPVWERLANLVAYPLIAVAIYQHIVSGLRVHSRQLQDISQASLDQIKSLLFLFDASRKMSGSLDLTTVLDNAVQGVAQALDADQCAIAFLENGGAGQMRLAAIYNPSRKGRGESVAFPLEYQLTVQQAMRRKKYIIVEESDNVQLKVLFALLGSSEVGPLLVQPLTIEGDAIGVIIVGNSRSRRAFAPNEAKLCQSMAEQLAGSIQNARRFQELQQRSEKLRLSHEQEREVFRQTATRIQEMTDRLAAGQTERDELRRQLDMARDARNALEIKLVSNRAEVDTLTERIAVLETDLAQAHANIEAQMRWHEGELARVRVDWEEAAQAVDGVQTVLQGLTAGILITDEAEVIQQANLAAEILLDRGSEELHGQRLMTIHADERWRQAVASASGGEAVRLTLQVGSNTLMCDVAPLPGQDLIASHSNPVIAILQDISAETDEQRNRLETLSTIAEELRTPMTTILSYTDLLLSETVGILGEIQRKFLLRTKAGAERAVQMIDDLIQQASIEERWTSPQRQEVNVTKLIEAAVAVSHVQLEDKDLTLDLDLPDDLPIIQADPDYLRRVLSSLISNACLASSVGGQVQIKALRSEQPLPSQGQMETNGDGFVVVSVKDSGGGLSDEALGQIFDRGRPSQTPLGLGESGAGLALAKTLIEAHGGRLWVESDQGIGATFSVVLPIANGQYPALASPAPSRQRLDLDALAR